MVVDLSCAKKRIDTLGKKLYGCVDPDTSIGSRLIKLPLALLLLVLLVNVFSFSLGIAFIAYPRFLVIVALVLTLTPLLIILLAALSFLSPTGLRRIVFRNCWIWPSAMAVSGASLLLCVSLGFFDGGDWLPGEFRERVFSSTAQFPLRRIASYTIDEEGRLYFGIQGYERIQVYDSQGSFLQGWFIPANGGFFDIWFEDAGPLNVFVYRTDHHLVYGRNGELIDSREISSREVRNNMFEKRAGSSVLDRSGRIYTLEDSRWFPKLLRTDEEGQATIVYEEPWFFCMLGNVLPPIIIALLNIMSIGIMLLIHKLVRIFHLTEHPV